MSTKLTTLHTYGTPREDNRIDFLIFLPHVSIDTVWIDFARSTFHENRDDISDELLGLYLYHEADIGTREVAESCIKQYENIDISIGILEVHVPRAFCDMNRPFARSIPPIMDSKKWQSVYEEMSGEIDQGILQSDFCLQLHSMCSFEPILSFQLSSEVSVIQIQEFLASGYSGKRRECTLLTSDTLGNYTSNKEYDSLLIESFQMKDIPLEQNTAYQLLLDYPATSIMKSIPSSLLEITKGSLANTTTIDMIDTNDIIFDTNKIDIFGKILMHSIRHFTHKI